MSLKLSKLLTFQQGTTEEQLKSLAKRADSERFVKRMRYTKTGMYFVVINDENSRPLATSKQTADEEESKRMFNAVLKELGKSESSSIIPEGPMTNTKTNTKTNSIDWAAWEQIAQRDFLEDDLEAFETLDETDW